MVSTTLLYNTKVNPLHSKYYSTTDRLLKIGIGNLVLF